MSLVNQLERIKLERNVGHKAADATFAVVITDAGEKQLQIDTYGSSERKDKTPGHRAQSIRFTSEAIEQLKKILKEF
jgi:hypothetical protein